MSGPHDDRGSGLYSDTPARAKVEVDVDVNVKATDKTKPKCEHENNIGECILCWKAEQTRYRP